MAVRKIENLLNKLIDTMESARTDCRKFDDGNLSAGVRARKIFQQVREDSFFARKEIQRLRRKRGGGDEKH